MRYILYCAIKKQRLVMDTMYSIFTIIHTTGINKNLRIVIVTDQTERFIDAFEKTNFKYRQNIILEHINEVSVNNWVGEDNYIFRVKIKAIEYFLNKYKTNVLFFDSDTIALKNIDPLFDIVENKKIIMYYNYKNIKKHLFYLFDVFDIDKTKLDYLHIINDKLYVDGFDYSIPCEYSYYASPVLGIHHSYNCLLGLVLDFCDKLYKITAFGTTEEIAFSYVFQGCYDMNIEVAHSYIRTHRLINEYSIIFFPYIFNIQTINGKISMEEYLSNYKIPISILDNIQLNYDNFLYFLPIFNAYIKKQPLSYIELLSNSIKDGFITNTTLSKKEFTCFFNQFKELFVTKIQ